MFLYCILLRLSNRISRERGKHQPFRQCHQNLSLKLEMLISSSSGNKSAGRSRRRNPVRRSGATHAKTARLYKPDVSSGASVGRPTMWSAFSLASSTSSVVFRAKDTVRTAWMDVVERESHTVRRTAVSSSRDTSKKRFKSEDGWRDLACS